MAKIVLKGSLFDGKQYVEDGVVVVDESTGLVSDSGKRSDVEIPKETRKTIAGEGLTIIPGLVDAHVHFFGSTRYDLLEWVTTPDSLVALRSVDHMRKLLYAGFTAVRDLGSKVGTHLSRAVSEGIVEGPRIISAAKSLAQTGGDDDPTILPLDIAQRLSYSYYCDGPWDCRRAVRLCIRDGAEVIKVYASGSFAQGGDPRPQLTVEELRAIVDEAHKNGLKVAAHAYGETPLANAIEAGSRFNRARNRAHPGDRLGDKEEGDFLRANPIYLSRGQAERKCRPRVIGQKTHREGYGARKKRGS